MDQHTQSDRRGFLKTAAGVSGGLFMGAATQGLARPLTEREKLDRIASNTWPIRYIFRTRTNRPNPRSEEMKKKDGEITMLDFPTFTKETFPAVYHMHLFSGLFAHIAALSIL